MRSPYYFVPQVEPNDPMLKHKLPVVVCPEWGQQVSHDIPFADGISGWIDLTITNKTPLFIRDSVDHETHYKTPKGAFAIPGTSLRGMLRNVFEIASFSRIQFINEHRYSVRDLQNRDLYTGHMTEEVGAKTYQPTAQAGWLTRDSEGNWFIQPCDHWRVECTHQQSREGRADLESTFGCRFAKRVVNVSDRYDELGPAGRDPVWFTGDTSAKPYVHSRRNKLVYKVVHTLTKEQEKGQTKGWVILTGRPMERKHMDFVFAEPSTGRSLRVRKEQMEDFRFIHSDGAEQHSDTPKPNNARHFWERRDQDQNDEIPGIPVFYLLREGSLRSFGLAQMFKLAYDHSPAELNRMYLNTADPTPSKPDFAEVVFGHTRTETDESAVVDGLRGRVTIETAVSDDAEEGKAFPAILGSPKASYYPAYIRQQLSKSGKVNKRYKTYMNSDAQIAGWKRYQQKPFATPPVPTAEQKNVTVTLKPLREGATFTTRMFIHNLRPEELGGLLWCLDFGGDSKCRHQLGMGRPFGMGGVQITMTGRKLKHVVSGVTLDDSEFEQVKQTFVSYMNDWFCGEWESSEQIRDLCALATPGGGREEEFLDYMRIEPENEFTYAKKKENMFALPGPRPFDEVQQAKQERRERMKECVAKKAEEHRAKQKEDARQQAEAKRLAEEQIVAIEREILLGMTPNERIEKKCHGLNEGELWKLVQHVFPDGNALPLLGDLDLPAEPEVKAFHQWLMGHEWFADWSRGHSSEGVAGKKNLKAVYALVTGTKQIDHLSLIRDVGSDTEKLQKLVTQALDENWPKAARAEFIGVINKTLKGGRKWKKNKQAKWKESAKKLKND